MRWRAMMWSRSLRGLLPLACAASLLLAPGARALEVFEVFLGAAELGEGSWFFEIEVEGDASLVSATLTPPLGGAPVDLSCGMFGGEAGCEFLDPPEDSQQGFASLEDLLAAWPVGTYVLTVSDGSQTLNADIPFDPVAPDGLLDVISPADRAVDVSPTPTVSYVHDCTNCTHFFVDIESFAPPPNDVELEFGTTDPAQTSVAFGDFLDETDQSPAPLPDGSYFLFGGTANAVESTPAFNEEPANSFILHMGAERERMTTFTVPEPEAYAAAAASLGTLGLLGLRGRRGRGRARA